MTLPIRRFFQGERTMNKLIVLTVLGLSSMSAFAAPAPVPAPETLPLLAIGAIAGVAAWATQRKKKK
jgi:hypothetical protein